MSIIARSVAFLASIALFVFAAPFGITADRPLGESAVVTTMARAQIAVGDRLAAAGDFETARNVYDVAAKMVRSQSGLPEEAVRRIANAYYFEGDYENAAATLDRLALEALAFDETIAELWALADAAWLVGLGDGPADVHWQRVERRLESADLPSDVREEIRAKLTADLTVRAPHLASW